MSRSSCENSLQLSFGDGAILCTVELILRDDQTYGARSCYGSFMSVRAMIVSLATTASLDLESPVESQLSRQSTPA